MRDEEFEQRLTEVVREPDPKEALYRLSDLYFIASPGQRERLRDGFDYGRRWEYPGVRTLAAHLPGEPDRELRIRAMLIALSLAHTGGSRDLLPSLCPIYQSIKAVGRDADAWFKFFADMSSPVVASALSDFASRNPEGKSLDAWLWESEVTEQGLVFKPKSR